MSWIVIVIGLAAQPTFIPEPDYAGCTRRVEHINRVYGNMVHARCAPVAEARKLGY